MRIPKTTLEQWRVLQAIVEYGGFAQAAERLNRSQSAVSYAVARLQERAGVDLLVIDGRKAQLTDAGRSLLAEAVPLVDELLRIAKPGAPIVLTVRDSAWEADGFKAKVEQLEQDGKTRTLEITHCPYHTKEDVYCELVVLEVV